MNEKRRKLLATAQKHLEKADDVVSEVLDDEEDCLSNWPESLEGSDRYIESENAIEAMDDALCSIRAASETLSNIISKNL